MTFKRIDKLVTQEDFSLQCWSDRYSKGVWAALGTHDSEVDWVRDLSSAGDLDMMPAMDYVFSANWLPYVTGRTLTEALTNLEARLAELPEGQLSRQSKWAGLVCEAIRDLGEAYRQCNDYGDLQTRIPPDLPASFAEASLKQG